MNDIGLVLTADARAMIKALKDAEGSLKTFSVKTEADLARMQKAAKDTDKALAGMGQGLSTSQVNKGLLDLNRNLSATGQTAKQTAAALRGVPAQITDIVVSLQGGQAPMTVFLQQGGQLKDVFGGVVPAAKALTASVLGMINPVTLAVGAFVALGAALRAGNQEQQAFRMAIANTGNAAGVTVDQMNGMAEAMGEGFGKTAGKARDALTAMASTGRVARADLQQFAQVAIDVERVTGQSLEKTAENFAALGKDPLGASLRLSETMNYLTVETYKQIKAAQDLGNTQQAAAIAQQAYADAEEARITRAVDGVGYIERAWKAVTGAAVASWSAMKEVWDWLKSIGRDDPLTKQLAAAEKSAADLQNIVTQYSGTGMGEMRKKELADTLARIESIKEQIRLGKSAGDAEAERVAANTKGIKALIDEEKNASKVKAEADRKRAAAAKELSDAVATYQGLIAKESGLSASFAGDWDKISLAYKKGKITADELLEAQRLLLDQQPFMIQAKKDLTDAAKAEIKLAQDTQKVYEDGLKPYLQATKAAEDRVKSLETEEAALQISESMNVSLAQAVEMVNIAKLKEKQIDAMGNEDAVAAIQKEIDAREKLVSLIGNKEARDASAKAAKQAATDWQRAAEKIQDSITDALMRGFESGKSFAMVLRDTVINMFKTMVLRPVIQGVVGGVMGMGVSAAGASGIEGIASTLAQKYITSAISGSILGSSAAYGAAIGTTSIAAGSQAAMLAAQTGSFGAAGLSATAGAAGTGSSMMASAAAAGPYVAAAVLALNALGVFRSNKTVGSGITGTLGGGDLQTYDLNRRGGSLFSGPSYSIQNVRQSPESQAIQNAFAAMRAATAGMAAQLGLANDSIVNFTTRLGSDLIHPDTGGYGIKLDGLNPEQAAAKVQDALTSANEKMAQMLLGTFEDVITPRTGLFARGRTTTSTMWTPGNFVREGETATQALQRLAGSLSAVNGVLATMNQSLMATSLAGGDAASKLLDLFGGLENFTQATGAYYQAFYTEAERNAKTTEQMTTALSSMGMRLPETVAGFRALVEAQDLTTEAGRKAYAALIALSPAFAQVANAAGAMAAKMGRVVADLVGGTLTDVDRQIEASQNAADAARDLAMAYQDAGLSLSDAAKQILMTIGSLAKNTEQEYRRTLALAQGGNIDAMGALPGAATAMIGGQRNASSTKLAASLFAAQTAAELAQVAKTAQGLGAQKDYQAKLYDVNTAMLQVLREALSGDDVSVDLLRQHLTALNGINGMIEASKDVSFEGLKAVEGETSTVAEITDLVARATGNNEMLSLAILKQLQVPDAGSNFLSQTIMTGNEFLAGRLEGVIAAINKQSQAQQAELKRQQDLAKAQADLENIYSAQMGAISQANQRLSAAQSAYDSTNQAYTERWGRVSGYRAYKRENYLNEWAAALESLSSPLADARSTLSATEQSAANAIEQQRQIIRSLGGIPAFAAGGLHAGGMRLVGENGPELEVTGPARYYSAAETSSMMGGGMVDELRGLREEVAMLRAEARATAINTGRTQDIMKRITKNGESMIVSTDGEALEVTAP